MFAHNSVATTCTASLLTGFYFKAFKDLDDEQSTEDYIGLVNQLISLKFKLDFAIIFCFTTGKQLKNPRVEHFLKSIGFVESFKSKKDNSESRHKDTGDLVQWSIRPADYKEGLLKFKADLLKLRAHHNRPKIQDPERLKFPELNLFNLRKAALVRNNMRVDNDINPALLVTPDAFYAHIRMVYGYDIKKNLNIPLEHLTVRYLKESHEAWRTEKCIYA